MVWKMKTVSSSSNVLSCFRGRSKSITQSLNIMTDHADINKQWFQDCVVEHWRKAKKLVPHLGTGLVKTLRRWTLEMNKDSDGSDPEPEQVGLVALVLVMESRVHCSGRGKRAFLDCQTQGFSIQAGFSRLV